MCQLHWFSCLFCCTSNCFNWRFSVLNRSEKRAGLWWRAQKGGWILRLYNDAPELGRILHHCTSKLYWILCTLVEKMAFKASRFLAGGTSASPYLPFKTIALSQFWFGPCRGGINISSCVTPSLVAPAFVKALKVTFTSAYVKKQPKYLFFHIGLLMKFQTLPPSSINSFPPKRTSKKLGI